MSFLPSFDAPTHAAACGDVARSAPTTPGSTDLLIACAYGDAAAVKRLLAVATVNPAAHSWEALRVAASLGHAEVVALFVADARVQRSYDSQYGFSRAIGAAAARGDISVVDAMVSGCASRSCTSDHNDALCAAASNGHLAVVECILAAASPDRTELLVGNALFHGAEHGHLHVVAPMLAHPSCRLRTGQLQAAASGGDTRILRLLLGDARMQALPSLSPSTLWNAAKAGHLDALQLLLAEPRCVCDESLSLALMEAAALGYLAIVDLLLRFTASAAAPAPAASSPGGVELNFDSEAVADAMVRAAAFGHADLLGRFLVDARIRKGYPSKVSRALAQAATHGRIEVLECLLADRDGLGDPTARNFAPVWAAAGAGQMAALRRLLADPRVEERHGDAAQVVLAALDAAAPRSGLMRGEDGCDSHDAVALARHAATRAVAKPDMGAIREVMAQALADATASVLGDAEASHEALQAMAIRAAGSGRADLVARLLADPRLVVSTPYRGDSNAHIYNAGAALHAAAMEGHAGVLQLLLAACPCWTREDCQKALATAAARGHVSAVQALLGDPRVDPTADRYAAFRAAAKEDRAAVLAKLMGDDRVNSRAAGAQVLAGLCDEHVAAKGDYKYVRRGTFASFGHVELLQACLAAAPSAGLPSFLQRAARVALPLIASRAWERRTHVLAARKRALSPE